MMPKTHQIEDPHYLQAQYRNSVNLNARIRLHQEFSTNPYGWQRWLFDQVKFPPQGRLLELGCGAGNLWLENNDRIPGGLEITLSDFSPGMLEQARQNLQACCPSIQFEVIDAQSIPYPDESFDLVLANHMLYHLPDREKALQEIRRVLKSDGTLYASTIDRNHLVELRDLVCRFDPQIRMWGSLPAGSFSLENGCEELAKYFAQTVLYHYEDSLLVTDPGLLAEYILSGFHDFTAEQRVGLVGFIEAEMVANGGRLHISKDSGIFEAWGIK